MPHNVPNDVRFVIASRPVLKVDLESMAKQNKSAADTTALVPSHRLLSVFGVYLRWYIRRHFHALRLAHLNRFPLKAGPLIVFLNHPSWWDPLTCIVLSRRLLPGAYHYAPMEAAALKHYALLGKLGLFAVESGTPRGAAQFLRAAQQILSTPNSVLWITPEGHFTDMRTRPAVFRPGLAALVARLGPCTLLPLAIEYTFWDERLPEILVSCGQPITVPDGRTYRAAEWSHRLAAAMTVTQDELLTLAAARDPGLFTTILTGGAGVGGVYDLWKRFRARLRGRPYQSSHGSIPRS